jgi:hypothetical protein
LKRLVITLAVLIGVLAPSTPAYASSTWYWYYSQSTGGCWNTVAAPGSPAYVCNNVAASYVPTYQGQNTYIHNGAFGDVTSAASRSGDYCNSYDDQVNGDSFSGDVDANPYYYGDPSTTDTFNGSYCYADGDVWGPNDNQKAGTTPLNPGVQHFASVQGITAKPWSFGTSPVLYVRSNFGVQTNSSTHAWGYLCADLKDAGTGDTLEICADDWDWGSKNAPNNVGGCSSGTAFSSPPLGMVEDYLAAPGTTEVYTTTQPGSSYTSTGAKTLTSSVFSYTITAAQVIQAAKDTNRVCGLAMNTTSAASYRLMGVEQGVELGNSTGDVNSSTGNLQFATLYN